VPDSVDEQGRFLHRSVARGYTHVPQLGARGEPEALSGDEQAALTRAAHERWRGELQRQWGEARSTILGATEQFRSAGRLDHKLAGDVRLVERAVLRVDRDVGIN
jgi:hypothetical protein